MKKIILAVILLFSVLLIGAEFSNAEKKEILIQLQKIQQAIKNQDINVISQAIDFPLDGEEILGYNRKNEIGVEEELTSKNIVKYKNAVFDNLKNITLPIVKLEMLYVIDYKKNNATKQDKERKYYFDEETYKYFYNKSGKRIYLDKPITNDEVSVVFTKNGISICDCYVVNELLPDSGHGNGGQIYDFIYKNGKLKLTSIYEND